MKELLVNIWTECCTRCNCNSPDVVEGRIFIILSSSSNMVSIFGRPEVKDRHALDSVHAYRQVCRQKGCNHTICLAVSQVFGLVHYTVPMGWMTRESFTEFLTGTATHLDENETHFRWAPAHRRPEQPRDNANLRILPLYSLFLNIVEQAISCLKASIKEYISRPAMQERFVDRNAARKMPTFPLVNTENNNLFKLSKETSDQSL